MKKTMIVLAAIALLTVGGLQLLGSTAVPPIFVVASEINLPATPEESWAVLTDFEQYPDWNPYLPRVEGVLAPGEPVSFTLVADNFDKPIDLTAQLVEVRAPEILFWKGTLLLRGIHDTRHIFKLVPLPDGTTQLQHYEEFRGILAYLLPNREQRMASTLKAFNTMNTAMQQRLSAASL